MGDREWIHPLLLYWHWQRFGGILCAQASLCVPFIAVAWPLARGSGTHAVLYSVNPPMGAGHMGVCPAGICPASGSQWPPHAGHRVFIAYRLPVAITKYTCSQRGSYCLLSLSCYCLLTLCCPYSSRRVLSAYRLLGVTAAIWSSSRPCIAY